MKARSIFAIISVLVAVFVISCHSDQPEGREVSILPVPEKVSVEEGQLCLSDTLYLYFEDATLDNLYDVLADELKALAGITLMRSSGERSPQINLSVDASLPPEGYRLSVGDGIEVAGHDYGSVAMGTVSLLQLLITADNAKCMQRVEIEDWPDAPWRSLLIDVARREHDLETVKRVVRLCRFYKVRYLQLHLTDNQRFTFPSEAFPELPTEAEHFSREELGDLVEFAHAHGVELIPELEVPGHASQMIKKLPGIFGFDDPVLNRNTINMASDATYAALDTLIGEVARVFRHSRYIHMGGDEANFSGMEEDPQVRRWMRSHNLNNIDELFWHFINRVNAIIKKHGKSTVVWEGFSKEGNAVLDKDITVMAWETIYQMPQDLLDGGFKIINVSWVPNYVVNDRKWQPLEIYHWNPRRWENWVPHMPSYKPFEIELHPNIIGGGMASWEQDAFEEISSLRLRIPAMVERLWNFDSDMPDSVFLHKLLVVDSAFSDYLTPVVIEETGRTFPNVRDGRYNEETWFHDTLYVNLKVPNELSIRYTLNGTPVTARADVYQGPIVLARTGSLRYRAFDGDEPVGAEMLSYYELHPLKVHLEGRFLVPLDSIWRTLHNDIISYRDSVTIHLAASKPGAIRYVVGDTDLTKTSAVYQAPIVLSQDSVIFVRAGLFVDGVQTGELWEQRFKEGSTNE